MNLRVNQVEFFGRIQALPRPILDTPLLAMDIVLTWWCFMLNMTQHIHNSQCHYISVALQNIQNHVWNAQLINDFYSNI